jgi:beta-mannanase
MKKFEKLSSIILTSCMILLLFGITSKIPVKTVTALSGENIAYQRTITATSTQSDDYKPEYAVDANGESRWASQSYDNQNLIVDLWSVQTVGGVKIAWEDAYASQFQVQVSTDNQNWQTVYENYSATGGTQEIPFSAVQARYVKIYLIKRATEYGFSIYEFEIYGNQSGGQNALSNIRGKRFIFLGSSVTYGYASNGVSFVDYLSQRNNCTCVKEAVSGTTLVDNGNSSYVKRMLNNLDKTAKCDHFICQLSTNDASQNLPLGAVSSSKNLSDFNTETIIGAMEYIICYAKETWNCPVSFYTNTYYDFANYGAMVNALYSLKDKWNIGIIDLYNNQAMRNVSTADYNRYMSDNIHPTATGYLEWWTPVFEDYFQNFDYSDYITVSDASVAKQNVLDYLYSIQGQKTVIGMHNREPNSEPAKQTNQVHDWTGKYPALWSGEFLFSNDDVNNRWKMIYECKAQWEAGSIVQLMLHVVSPTQNEPGNWEGGVVSSLSDAQWSELITDGTNLNNRWKARLDIYADYIQYLKDNGVPILFRPFHEMNQGIFWWAGRKGQNGTGALYRLTRDYLENEKGLDNIIWVWDMQDLSYDWADYNPGNDYWDIFAVDVYNGDYFTDYKYNQALSVAGNKLIAVGECDKLPTSAELKNQPRWSFVMSWAELTFSHNTGEEIQNLYWADNVIVREELPDLKPTPQIPDDDIGENDVYLSTVIPENSSITDGDEVTFATMLRNIGENKTGDLQVTFYLDNKKLETVDVASRIEAGKFIVVKTSVSWQSFLGSHTIRAIVSEKSTNLDIDNTNNALKQRFNVRDN